MGLKWMHLSNYLSINLFNYHITIMKNYAPILLFTYKRLEALKKTVENLQNNYLAKESDLYIFSDGAKSPLDLDKVSEVRKYLSEIHGFKNVVIYEASTNKGLAKSIIDGVTKIINEFGRVIVLEDDLLTTPNFLSFMNASLNKYEHKQNVFSISGYSFDLGLKNINEDIYLLNRGWSWGWSTWKDRWDKVDWQVKDYAEFSKSKILKRNFAKGGSDLNKMLQLQLEGKLDSWAIRWFYSQFKTKGLTVYPILSKVYNNGFDKDATHTTGSLKRYIPLLDRDFKSGFNLPLNVSIDDMILKKFQKKMGIKARIISKLDTVLNKIFISNRKE